MNENLSSDDAYELERRRLVEEVTESVEKTLKKRYTWLAILISFLIGGGVGVIVNGLTEAARDKLVRAQVNLEKIDELIKKGSASIENVQRLSDTIDEESSKVDKEIKSINEAKDTLRTNLSASLEEISILESRVESLIKAIEKISIQGDIKGIKLPSTTTESGVRKTIERTKLAEYTIFMHYSYAHKQDKPEIEKLATALKEKGYIVAGIEAVDGEVRDIRYFKDEDADAANELSKFVEEYLKTRLDIPIDLATFNLQKNYPKIRKGTIELWLYL